ncbi:MAG: nucleoside monophosphate kinase [Janthinobacterium lividum]
MVFVIGPPGAGKTTLTKEVGCLDGISTICLGDVFRSIAKIKDSNILFPFEKIIKQQIMAGGIVPPEITIKIISTYMVGIMGFKNCFVDGDEDNMIFIIDGFPYNMENYNEWKKFITQKPVKVLGTILIDTPDTLTLVNRLQSRQRAGEDDKRSKERIAYFREHVDHIIADLGRIDTIDASLSLEETKKKMLEYLAMYREIKTNKY